MTLETLILLVVCIHLFGDGKPIAGIAILLCAVL